MLMQLKLLIPPSSTILDHPDDEDSSDQESGDEVALTEAACLPSASELNPSNLSVSSSEDNTTFTPEQLQLFQTRYENGYVKLRLL